MNAWTILVFIIIIHVSTVAWSHFRTDIWYSIMYPVMRRGYPVRTRHLNKLWVHAFYIQKYRKLKMFWALVPHNVLYIRKLTKGMQLMNLTSFGQIVELIQCVSSYLYLFCNGYKTWSKSPLECLRCISVMSILYKCC